MAEPQYKVIKGFELSQKEMEKSKILAYGFLKEYYEKEYNYWLPHLIKDLTGVFARKIFQTPLLTRKQDLELAKAIEEVWGGFILWSFKIFRGSSDQFSAKAFHKVCDNPKLLSKVILIESNWGNIFGAFTGHHFGKEKFVKPLALDEHIKRQDPDYMYNATFLFLIKSDNKEVQDKIDKNGPIIFPIREGWHSKWAVWGGIDTVGPVFGYGFDIYIDDKCNTKKEVTNEDGETEIKYRNSSYLKTFYNEEVPDVILCGGNVKQKNYLHAEEPVFDVKEYEVFEVIC